MRPVYVKDDLSSTQAERAILFPSEVVAFAVGAPVFLRLRRRSWNLFSRVSLASFSAPIKQTVFTSANDLLINVVDLLILRFVRRWNRLFLRRKILPTDVRSENSSRTVFPVYLVANLSETRQVENELKGVQPTGWTSVLDRDHVNPYGVSAFRIQQAGG